MKSSWMCWVLGREIRLDLGNEKQRYRWGTTHTMSNIVDDPSMARCYSTVRLIRRLWQLSHCA